jgi:hypothetical protein
MTLPPMAMRARPRPERRLTKTHALNKLRGSERLCHLTALTLTLEAANLKFTGLAHNSQVGPEF